MIRFSKNKIANNTILLYGGIILNITLGWVLAKLNTRFLSVEDYGKYTFFINVIYYSRTYFSAGAFESTSRLLALSGTEQEKKQLFGTTIVSTLFFIFLFWMFFTITSSGFDAVFKVKVGSLLANFALVSGLILLQSMLIATLRGSAQIGLLSFITFTPRVFYVLLLVIVIFSQNFNLTSTLQSLFGGMAIAILTTLIIIRPDFRKFKFRFKQIFEQVKSYGIYIYSGNILHETLFHSDKFIVSYFLDSTSMAYYGLAYMLTFPLSHFSTSLATTLFNKFTSQKSINPKVLRANLLFVGVSVSLFILLRRPIVYYLFSASYLPSVPVMLPLALAFGFSGLSKPYTLFLMAQGAGKTVRNISVAIPVVNISLNILFVPLFGIYGAAWSAFAAYLLDFILYWMAYRNLLRDYDS